MKCHKVYLCLKKRVCFYWECLLISCVFETMSLQQLVVSLRQKGENGFVIVRQNWLHWETTMTIVIAFSVVFQVKSDFRSSSIAKNAFPNRTSVETMLRRMKRWHRKSDIIAKVFPVNHLTSTFDLSIYIRYLAVNRRHQPFLMGLLNCRLYLMVF